MGCVARLLGTVVVGGKGSAWAYPYLTVPVRPHLLNLDLKRRPLSTVCTANSILLTMRFKTIFVVTCGSKIAPAPASVPLPPGPCSPSRGGPPPPPSRCRCSS